MGKLLHPQCLKEESGIRNTEATNGASGQGESFFPLKQSTPRKSSCISGPAREGMALPSLCCPSRQWSLIQCSWENTPTALSGPHTLSAEEKHKAIPLWPPQLTQQLARRSQGGWTNLSTKKDPVLRVPFPPAPKISFPIWVVSKDGTPQRYRSLAAARETGLLQETITGISFGAWASPASLHEACEASSALAQVSCTTPSVLCFSIYSRTEILNKYSTGFCTLGARHCLRLTGKPISTPGGKA